MTETESKKEIKKVKKDSASFERRLTIGIVFANIVITSIGGWYFIGRYQARMYEATEKLTNLQGRLVELQIRLGKEKEEFETALEKIRYSKQFIDIMAEVRPNVDVQFEHKSIVLGTTTLLYLVKNLSKRRAFAEPVYLRLFSHHPKRGGRVIYTMLTKDFEGQLGQMAPGQTLRIGAEIPSKFAQKFRYYELRIRMRTDDYYRQAVENMAKAVGIKVDSGFFYMESELRGDPSYVQRR